MKELINLTGGLRNILKGISEGVVLLGTLAAVYTLAMLAPMM